MSQISQMSQISPISQISCQPELEDCPEAELTSDELQAVTYYNEAIYHQTNKNWPDYVFNLLWACELGHHEAELEYCNLNNLPDFTGLLEMVQETLDKNPQHSYFITFLGYMYDTGSGVAINNTKAEELYTRAISLGNSMAMFNLANIHHLNNNYNLALELYQKAAKLNNGCALASLGHMYITGQGLPPDPVQAKEYYKKSIKFGSHRAKNSLAHIYLTRGKQDKARKLFESAIEHGDFIAMNNLAFMYQKGTVLFKIMKKLKICWSWPGNTFQRLYLIWDLCILKV